MSDKEDTTPEPLPAPLELSKKEKRKAKSRADAQKWRERHREQHRAESKANYHANKEVRKASRKAHRDANPEENRDRCKEYREAHHEERRAKERAYYHATKEARRTQIRARAKARYAARKCFAYGLSKDEYQEMLRACRGRCPCCLVPFSSVFGTVPVIDHCHDKGFVREAVRGIICSRCNFVMGHASDSPKVLRACALYLERFARESRDRQATVKEASVPAAGSRKVCKPIV
jgi:hypothetical protein